MRHLTLPLALLLSVSCAGIVPSRAVVEQERGFRSPSEVPASVRIESLRIASHPGLEPELTGYLEDRLRERGWRVDDKAAEAAIEALTTWAVHGHSGTDVRLSLQLKDPADGRILWSCELTRDYDLYASLTDGIRALLDAAVERMAASADALRKPTVR